MRVVIQRVKEAKVVVDGKTVGAIKRGLMVLLGIGHDDTKDDCDWLVKKVINTRIFNDDEGVMNKSLLDVNGELLVISQFTLMASTKKGNRPSYIDAAKHNHAILMYESFCSLANQSLSKEVQKGVFGADMQVSLTNDGPVTLCIDSKNKQ